MIDLTKIKCVTLGRQGETGVTELSFSLNIFDGLGDGYATIIHQRASDEEPYIVEHQHMTRDSLVWVVNAYDTAVIGNGQAEIRWTDGERVKKSVIITTKTTEALREGIEPPEYTDGWIEELIKSGAETATSAAKAKASANKADEAAVRAENHATDARRSASEADYSSVTAESYMDASKAYSNFAKEHAEEAEKSLNELKAGIASGDFKGEKGDPGRPGDPGAPGAEGKPGKDYVITDADYDEIADKVKEDIKPASIQYNPVDKSLKFSGYVPLVDGNEVRW